LTDHVLHGVHLGRREPDGATRRDHLMAAERAGIRTGELDPPPLPPGGDVLLDVYWRLRRSAGGNGMGMNAVSLHDVLAYQQAYGVALLPEEIDWLLDIDAAVLAAIAEKD